MSVRSTSWESPRAVARNDAQVLQMTVVGAFEIDA